MECKVPAGRGLETNCDKSQDYRCSRPETADIEMFLQPLAPPTRQIQNPVKPTHQRTFFALAHDATATKNSTDITYK